MTGLGYTVPAVAAVLTVGALELAVLRTGLFRRPAYWLSMLIVLGFQIPVDGWLTKLSCPDRQLRPSPDHRPALPVRHPGRGFPVRLRAGHRGAAAMGTPTCASVKPVPPRGQLPAAFDAGATAYDRLVGASPGYHEQLLLSARRMRIRRPRQGLTAARRRVRHRRVDGRAAGRGPGGRDRRRRRVAGHARRGGRQGLAAVGAVRAHSRRAARRARHHRTVRRHPGRLPDPQPRRPGRPIAETPDAAATRRHPGGARILGARLPRRHPDLARRVLGHHHPRRVVAHP